MNDVDLIISWLNPEDDHWCSEFSKYKKIYKGDSTPNRIQDYGTFKYFLRSIKENLPFIRKVFLVLNDEYQIPNWLNIECEKLRIVFLKEFVPNQLLPQFNTLCIESFYHLIPDLSEKFIFCNDDMIINSELSEDYFFNNGLPVDIDTKTKYISCNPVDALNNRNRDSNGLFGKIVKNTLNFGKRKYNNMSFYLNTHMPCPFLKSKWFEELKIEDLLDIFKNSKFRQENHIATILLMRMIRLHKKEFVEKEDLQNIYSYYDFRGTDVQFKNIMSDILNGKILCLNDCISKKDLEKIKIKLYKILNTKFPKKSCFEK